MIPYIILLKLQKIAAYTYKDKTQYKYVITIPEETVQKLGWKEGSQLKHTVKDDYIIVEFHSMPNEVKEKVIEPKISYEEFGEKIKNLLLYNDNGMTWTEIRNKLKFDQVVPNNKWVRQMEKDIGLIRIKDIRGIVWKLRHVY